jgi:hypothetical protein
MDKPYYEAKPVASSSSQQQQQQFVLPPQGQQQFAVPSQTQQPITTQSTRGQGGEHSSFLHQQLLLQQQQAQQQQMQQNQIQNQMQYLQQQMLYNSQLQQQQQAMAASTAAAAIAPSWTVMPDTYDPLAHFNDQTTTMPMAMMQLQSNDNIVETGSIASNDVLNQPLPAVEKPKLEKLKPKLKKPSDCVSLDDHDRPITKPKLSPSPPPKSLPNSTSLTGNNVPLTTGNIITISVASVIAALLVVGLVFLILIFQRQRNSNNFVPTDIAMLPPLNSDAVY